MRRSYNEISVQSTVQIIDEFYMSTWYVSIIYEYNIDPHNNHLPFGLIVHMLEHCTGVGKVWVRVPFRPKVLRPYPLLPTVNNSADYTSKIHSYLILTVWFMSSTYSSFRLVRLEKIVPGSWDILFASRYLAIN